MTADATTDQRRLRDLLLVALTLSVGAIDAMSVVVLDRVFSAFMTGNVVYLGLEAAGGDGPPTLRLVVALVAFGAGAFAAARVVRPSGEGRLWPASITAVLAGTAVLELTLWVLWLAVGGRPGTASAHVLTGGYAFAMGMQTTAVFSLGVRAVFTTAATATWTVLMTDVAHPRESREELVRLAAVVGAVFAGALAGTLLVLHVRDLAPLLPLVVTSGVAWVAARALHGRPRARPERSEPYRPSALSG